MPSFYVPQLKAYLPLLEECYGFDICEVSDELSWIVGLHRREKRLDDELVKQHLDENGYLSSVSYAINTNEHLGIRVTENFDEQIDAIVKLCGQCIEDRDLFETVAFILVFMSAVFNRDENDLHLDEEAENIRQDFMRNTYVVRPDLLRLFVALNKPKHKNNTPMKICFKTDSPHMIHNKDGWFSYMLNDYIKQKLGNITIEEAEAELEFFYSDEKGRKSDNPYLNYIINGTYNFIKHFMPSDKVTVEQCKFLLEYLKAIGQVKEGDTLANLNTLQSTVKSLISSKHTPVEKHVKRKNMPSLPIYQRVLLD